MMNRAIKLAAVMCVACAAAVSVWAQNEATQDKKKDEVRDPAATQERQAVRQGQAGQQAGPADQKLAACMLWCNQKEIALAKLALEKAQNPKVKQFAELMMREHAQSVEQLTPLAGQYAAAFGSAGGIEPGAAGERARTQPGAKRGDKVEGANPDQATRNPDEPAAGGQLGRDAARRSIGGAGGEFDFVEFQPKAGNRWLALTIRELKECENFDKAYIGTQIGTHIGALAELQTAQEYASGELAALVAQNIDTAEKHFKHAKQLMKDLDTPTTARRAGETVKE